MKIFKYSKYIFFAFFLSSCEDVIDLKTLDVAPILAVDGTITDKPGAQKIKLNYSQKLLSKSDPLPYLGAKVTVTDNNNKVYEFIDVNKNGVYIWQPKDSTEVMGKIGNSYILDIEKENEKYTAKTELKRVPKVDSIQYKFGKDQRPKPADDLSPKEGFETRFYANDFKGFGDCYKVTIFKNNIPFANADNFILVYDAFLNKGNLDKTDPKNDGLMFIIPIRRAAPEYYLDGDKMKIEIRSITEAHFDFYTQLRTELNNTGLSAPPPARIPSNIENKSAGSKKDVAGWFGASAISSFEITIDKNKAVKELSDNGIKK